MRAVARLALAGRPEFDDPFLDLTAAVIRRDQAKVKTFLRHPNIFVRASAIKQSLRAGWLGAPERSAVIATAPPSLRRMIRRYALAPHPRRATPPSPTRVRSGTTPVSTPAAVAALIEHAAGTRDDRARLAALTELAPAARQITAASVPALARIVAAANELDDFSEESATALRRLEAAVLRHHLDDRALISWSLHTFYLPGGPAGVGWHGRLHRGLPRDPHLFDTLCAWAVDAGDGGLFAAVHALGKRAWELPILQDRLEQVIWHAEPAWHSATAAHYWLADPATRPGRVAGLLARDPSTVVIPRVWENICAHQTDLLDLVLRGRGPSGRFRGRGVPWVPFGVRHPERWRPDQRAALITMMSRAPADYRPRAQAVAAACRV